MGCYQCTFSGKGSGSHTLRSRKLNSYSCDFDSLTLCLPHYLLGDILALSIYDPSLLPLILRLSCFTWPWSQGE